LRRSARLIDPSALAWSRLNIGEPAPGVATPLIWSVFSNFSEQGFRRAFASLGYKVREDARLIGNFRGRVYLNVTELAQVAMRVPGFQASLVLPGEGSAEAARVERTIARSRSAAFFLRLPGAATRFARANLRFGRRVEGFQLGFDAERARIESMDL